MKKRENERTNLSSISVFYRVEGGKDRLGDQNHSVDPSGVKEQWNVQVVGDEYG